MARELSQREQSLIDEVLAAYCSWAPEELQRPQMVDVLDGGHSHRSILLRGATQQWVLRLAHYPLAEGCCLARELRVQRRAAAAGLAPPVVFGDAQQGLLLCPYVDHAPGMETRADLATLLRAIHTLPQDGEILNVHEELARIRAQAAKGSPLGTMHARHTVALDTLQKRLSAHRFTPRLCHNDLLQANRRHSSQGLLALDWEYARSGDPFFDLAVCASEIPDQERDAFLALYLERPARSDELLHFHDCQLAYLHIAIAWYHHYAPERQERGELEQSLEKYL